MDTTVAHQLMESQTTSLTTYRIETTDNDSFRRIIDDDFHTGSGLKSTDISSLTTDDAAFHLIIIYMEHADGVLYSSLRSYTLDGLNHNLLGLLVGIQLGLIHNLVDITSGSGLGLVLHRLNQTVLGIFCTQSGNFLQFLTLLQLHLLKFLSLQAQKLLLVLNTLLLVVKLILATTHLFLTLVQ